MENWQQNPLSCFKSIKLMNRWCDSTGCCNINTSVVFVTIRIAGQLCYSFISYLNGENCDISFDDEPINQELSLYSVY